MEGVILLWHLGSYPIAMVIFFASVFYPDGENVGVGVVVLQCAKGSIPSS